MMESLAWWLLVRVTRWWSTRYMDQWDKFQFETKYGTVYVGLERETPWPDSFYPIDVNGKPAPAGGTGHPQTIR